MTLGIDRSLKNRFFALLETIFYHVKLKLSSKEVFMAGKIKPSDNSANQQNPNKGTSGTNRQYDQNQGNRGKQMNPNQKNK